MRERKEEWLVVETLQVWWLEALIQPLALKIEQQAPEGPHSCQGPSGRAALQGWWLVAPDVGMRLPDETLLQHDAGRGRGHERPFQALRSCCRQERLRALMQCKTSVGEPSLCPVESADGHVHISIEQWAPSARVSLLPSTPRWQRCHSSLTSQPWVVAMCSVATRNHTTPLLVLRGGENFSLNLP